MSKRNVPKQTYHHKDVLGAGAAKRHRLRASETKIEAVMHEFKAGTLRSGSGAKVKSRGQAIAIAMHESGQAKPMAKRKK